MPQDGANLNGAEATIQTLVNNGVDICFANPGTSEMHLVAALDQINGMRTVLGLFEGVVTGAADGYARMTGRPASTLLHLGPGFANGIANLHNAGRAGSRIVNLIGDQATYHRGYDAPLTSDIEGLAGPVSAWVRTSPDVASIGSDCRDAVLAAKAPGGGIATLIIPADVAWTAGATPGPMSDPAVAQMPDEGNIEAVARTLKDSGGKTLIMMGGETLLEDGLRAAARIQAVSGCQLMTPTFNARIERGAGRPFVPKLPYLGELAAGILQNFDHIVLVGTKPPVTFFGYPDKESWLASEGCEILVLTRPEEDGTAALEALAEALDAPPDVPTPLSVPMPELPSGDLTVQSVAASLANLIPEGGIVSDESITSGLSLMPATLGAAPHDWLDLTGGSLGGGMPTATGAALACPDRQVISLEGDGAAMYSIQSLWTQARENLDVVTVVYANRSYAILNAEHLRVGAGAPGEKARAMLSLDDPKLGFVELAEGMGVEAARVNTAEAFNDTLQSAIARKGPFLIEAEVDPIQFG